MNGAVDQVITEPVMASPEQGARFCPHRRPEREPATRSLKIEATGDFFLRKVTPKIRLTGRWLERAGFKPGHRVSVELIECGCLVLRFVEAG